jgi:hypothetical protein
MSIFFLTFLYLALQHVPNVNNVMDQELTSVGRDLYQMVVPWLVASATLGFDSSLIFFTDCSKSGVGAGFGVYHSVGSESSFRLREPSGVFTLEMLAIFEALIQIRDHRLGRYVTVSDSISSLKALQTLLQVLTRWYMKSRGLLVAGRTMGMTSHDVAFITCKRKGQ